MRYLITLLLAALSLNALGQVNTVGTIIYNEEATEGGFNLIYPDNQPDAFLLDMCGNVVHKWENVDSLRPSNVIYILENSDVMITYRPADFSEDAIWGGGGGATIERRTWDNEPIWSFTRNDAEYRLHHDIQPMANGNVLVTAWEQRDSLECIEAGRNPENLTGAGMWSEVVWVIAPGGDGLGEVVWEWAVWDHLVQDFDATKANYGVIADNIDKIDINFGTELNTVADWLHINAIDFDEYSQHIMLSVPTFNEIWVVDYGNTTPGELKWRWGNPMAYDRGDSTDTKLGFQHHTHWLDLALTTNSPDYGKIGVFNNRVQGDTSEYSSVHTLLPIFLEYENEYYVDPVTGTYLPTDFDWTFESPNPNTIFSNIVSSFQRLENGNSLICSGSKGDTREYTQEGELVWHYKTPFLNQGGIASPVSQGTLLNLNQNLTFRASRYPADYPAFDDIDFVTGLPIELNSNLINNECGVCGGGGIADGDCDCDGSQLDVCGVCGGDGSSCIQTVTHTIAEVQGELFSSPLIEQVVTVQGVITAANDYSYFIQDGSGPWNGVYIYDNTNLPAVGDHVILQGEVVEYYDLTEITNITYFETVSSGNDLPAAVELTTGFIGTSGEPYEGCLVKITNAACTNTDLGFGDAYFDDGSGDCMIDDMLYTPDPAWVLGEYYSVTGVLTYTYEEYKIEPSSASDVSIEFVGCMNTTACNYDEVATIDDDSCEFTSCTGCAGGFDFGEVGFGFSPDPALGETLEPGMVGQNYTDVIHIIIPATVSEIDPSFPPTLPIDSVFLESIVFTDTVSLIVYSPEELGLEIVCKNLDGSLDPCTFLGGNQYCISIEGVPNTSAGFSIDLNVLFWLTIFEPFSYPVTFSNFILPIYPDSALYGCIDSTACNYNPEADVNDGSCLILDDCGVCGGDSIACSGCTDESACNYNAEATYDDGSCESSFCLGCTIPFACNYDPQATQDDDSCIFICNGCTDLAACNYDLSANVDDGSCEFFSCAGCTDFETCNYNSLSTIDDGSCIYPEQYFDCFNNCINDSDSDGICDELEILGCTDFGACNYDTQVTDDNGSCEYITCLGCIYEFACNYDPDATISDNESCEFGTCPGCTDSTACNFNPTVSEDDGSCEYCSCNDCSDGCTNTEACNYDSNAISDDGSCLYFDECGECGGEGILEGACDCDGNVLDLIGVCGGDCTDDDDGNGVCDELEIYGCTYPDAMNFDSSATIDDGSCLYDDVSSDCPSDIDGDGTVTTQDLLSFLSFFGEICE